MAKLVSLVVKVGAVLFVVALPGQYAIQLQLLGGIWICQTLPSVFLGLYTRWFDHRGLIAGWLVGIGFGTYAAAALKFAGSTYPLKLGDLTIPGYAAVYALILNLVVAAVVTVVCRITSMSRPADGTLAGDYA
jgi:SSS family solute:Na+ symporter